MSFVDHVIIAIRLAAQGISHYISLARGIRYTTVVVSNSFHPPLLMEVQIWLSEQVLQTLMIGEDLATITEKVLSP